MKNSQERHHFQIHPLCYNGGKSLHGGMSMKRRSFLQMLFLGPLLGAVAPAAVAAPRRILIQRSPVAGFQYHQGQSVWPQLAVGGELIMVREPRNSHDERAVALYWHHHKLGYIPRRENIVVAQMLDRGEIPVATITRLMATDDPWQRVEFVVEVVV